MVILSRYTTVKGCDVNRENKLNGTECFASLGDKIDDCLNCKTIYEVEQGVKLHRESINRLTGSFMMVVMVATIFALQSAPFCASTLADALNRKSINVSNLHRIET